MNLTIKKVKQGAERYVNGKVTQFDQKNEGFKRPFWDPSLDYIREKFYETEVPPKDKPGYTFADQCAVNASWYLDSMSQGKKAMYAPNWDGNFYFPRVPKGYQTKENDPSTLTLQVKKVASFFGASLVGICKVDQRWLYSSAYVFDGDKGKPEPVYYPETCKFAVVMAFEMDYEAISYSPDCPSSAAVGLGYSQMAFTSGSLAHYIRNLGFQAIPSGNDTACSIPLAIDAGLGELARNGLLITPHFGPRVRLAKVFTDIPLETDQPIEFGVWNFCKICEKCADECPSKSIPSGDPTGVPHNISNRTGTSKWNVNAESCLKWWATNGTDCSNCIRVCPFNKSKGVLHDLVRFGISNLPSLNKFYFWGDEIMGYGKKQPPAQFWRK
jgi:epoxyqueuosine reductase